MEELIALAHSTNYHQKEQYVEMLLKLARLSHGHKDSHRLRMASEEMIRVSQYNPIPKI